MSTAPTILVSSKSAYNGPDSGLVRFQLGWLQDFFSLVGPTEFSTRTFWILRKNPEEGEQAILPSDSELWNRRLVPFVHNRIQRDLDENIIVAGSKRNIMLKPRQAGYTTWSIIMRLLMPALIEPGTSSMLISQNAEYAAAHFDILKRAWRYFFVADPYNDEVNEWAISLRKNLLHVAYSNRRELIFDQLDSRVRCASAEVEEVGQGITLNHLVATELSRWEHNPEETMANVKEAIAMDGTLDIECTPNGLGGYFYEEWNRANNVVPGRPREFKPHFHTWWWHDEYRRYPAIEYADMTEEERTLIANNPIQGNSIDGAQIAWRREKLESLRHNFAEKYPEDDVSCFIVSGNAFFEKEIVAKRIRELTGYQPIEKRNKFVRFANPVKHRRYVIGADPATGLPVTNENPDYSAAVVIDQDTGEEVCAYRAHVLPEDFANDLVELAQEYNDAHVCVERMSEGGSVITYMTYQLGYWNLYKHVDWFRKAAAADGPQKKAGSSGYAGVKELLGFPTNTRNRPLSLNRARYFLSTCPHLVWDLTYLKECSSFIYDEKGKPKAQEGAHDDTVLARALAYYARAVLNGEISPESIRREKYGAVPTEFAPKELIQ